MGDNGAGLRKMLIIGNGPSTIALADRGFDQIGSEFDTFGMGAAYRFFREVNWWPTYYALGDEKVVYSHRDRLAEVVDDPAVTTERFFFSFRVSDDPRVELIPHTSTGDFCMSKSVEMGYDEIYLIGIEGSYEERISGSRPLSDAEYLELGFDVLGLSALSRRSLRIIDADLEENPNYFFPQYQAKGDVYSLPRSSRHRERWGMVARAAYDDGAVVFNLSAESRVRAFPKTSIDAVLVSGDEASAKDTQSFWLGNFDIEDDQRIDEVAAVRDLIGQGPAIPKLPVMVDVGASLGRTLQPFAEEHWIVHAFEPNPPSYASLVENYDWPNVFLNQLAVSDEAGEDLPFFTSEESLGISSLSPFRDSHTQTAAVTSTTLDAYLDSFGTDRVEFLKVDTEGFDLQVLRGLDLDRHDVRAIVCEFEDRKTVPLGYTMQDLAGHLYSHGYSVYVSEWNPIIAYGGPHFWRCLKLFPCELDDSNAWGNLVAFKVDPGFSAVAKAFTVNLGGSSALRFADRGRYKGIKQQTAGSQVKQLRRRVQRLQKHKRQALARNEALEAHTHALENHIEALTERIEYFTGSKSWKVTAPMRRALAWGKSR